MSPSLAVRLKDIGAAPATSPGTLYQVKSLVDRVPRADPRPPTIAPFCKKRRPTAGRASGQRGRRPDPSSVRCGDASLCRRGCVGALLRGAGRGAAQKPRGSGWGGRHRAGGGRGGSSGAGYGKGPSGRRPAPPRREQTLPGAAGTAGEVTWRGRGQSGAWPGGGVAWPAARTPPLRPSPAARRRGRAERTARGRSGEVGARSGRSGMPTNFTVVPVDARADGGQDEAAEPTEAPGAPEGREPDRPSRGERGRTCPPDKGGAGLRGSGGAPGGAGTGGRVRICSPRRLPSQCPIRSSARLLLRSPHPAPAPSRCRAPTKPRRGAKDPSRAPGAGGSPPPLSPHPPRRARKHLVPALRVGQRGGVGGGRRPGVALETGGGAS